MDEKMSGIETRLAKLSKWGRSAVVPVGGALVTLLMMFAFLPMGEAIHQTHGLIGFAVGIFMCIGAAVAVLICWLLTGRNTFLEMIGMDDPEF